jgi:hypothetical protein
MLMLVHFVPECPVITGPTHVDDFHQGIVQYAVLGSRNADVTGKAQRHPSLWFLDISSFRLQQVSRRPLLNSTAPMRLTQQLAQGVLFTYTQLGQL